MTDKSDLLNQLKIDRDDETSNTGASPLALVVACVISLAIGGAGTYYFMPSSPAAPEKQLKSADAAVTPTAVAATTSTITTPAPKTEKTASLPGQEILNASGYITARRMATVSAEIMGLITDVTVEEGMLSLIHI